MSLTGKQKEKLRAKAHDLKPFIQIGKNGVTQGQINNIKKHLNNHHLIKIKFNEFKSQTQPPSVLKLSHLAARGMYEYKIRAYNGFVHPITEEQSDFIEIEETYTLLNNVPEVPILISPIDYANPFLRFEWEQPADADSDTVTYTLFMTDPDTGGILLEPNTGLSINDFSAGVEFFKSLPSIEEPEELRGPQFDLPTGQSADQWLASVKQQVVTQYQMVKGNPSVSGFLAAFTSPMLITGGGKVFTIYTSKEVFNGEVFLQFSTDGKFLIIGKLNFAADMISISGRLYADGETASGAPGTKRRKPLEQLIA